MPTAWPCIQTRRVRHDDAKQQHMKHGKTLMQCRTYAARNAAEADTTHLHRMKAHLAGVAFREVNLVHHSGVAIRPQQQCIAQYDSKHLHNENYKLDARACVRACVRAHIHTHTHTHTHIHTHTHTHTHTCDCSHQPTQSLTLPSLFCRSPADLHVHLWHGVSTAVLPPDITIAAPCTLEPAAPPTGAL
jgi:hypothetical protein